MEQAIHLIFLLCGIVAVGFVLCISVYLVISGLPAIREIGLTKFLFGKVWAPTNATTGPQFGILPFILTSVYGTAGALLLGVPVGLMTAIFLAKAAPPRLAAVIRTAVQLLAGIPSVVYGLVGMIVLVPAIRRAFGLGSGACLLAAMKLNAVWQPGRQKDAALGHQLAYYSAYELATEYGWDNKGARLSGVLVDKYYYYPLYYLGDNNLRWSEEVERMFLDHVAASPLGRSRIPGSSLLLGESWDLVESLIIHAVNPRSRLLHFTKDSSFRYFTMDDRPAFVETLFGRYIPACFPAVFAAKRRV